LANPPASPTPSPRWASATASSPPSPATNSPTAAPRVWAATIRAVRHRNPQTAIEVLTPDWKGKLHDLDTVLDAKPDIFNHNLETVERLQKPVRVQARYDRSRSVLQHAKIRGFTTKTGIMLGLGEQPAEIEQTLRDIAADKTDILTIGQYLQPTRNTSKIDRWAHPDEFAHWKQFRPQPSASASSKAGAMVRSSYHADEQSQKYTGVDHLNTHNTLASVLKVGRVIPNAPLRTPPPSRLTKSTGNHRHAPQQPVPQIRAIRDKARKTGTVSTAGGISDEAP